MTVGSNDTHVIAHHCVGCGHGLTAEAEVCPRCGQWVAEGAEVEPEDDSFFSWLQPVAPSKPGRQRSGSQPKRQARPTDRTHRLLAGTALGLAVLLVLVTAGLFGLQRMRDRPVYDGFDAAQSSYTELVRALATARDLDQVQAAGQRSVSAVRYLEDNRRAVASRNTDTAYAIDALLGAEVGVARAAAPLAHLSADNLSAWGPTHDALTAALADLTKAKFVLAGKDSESAQAVVDGENVLPNLEKVVGGAVTDAAEARLTGLLRRLSSTGMTAGIRDAAEQAAHGPRSIENALADVAASSRDAEQLHAFSDVYAAVTALNVVDADHLSDWGSLRASLVSALGVADGGRAMRAAGRAAVANVNRLVEHATARLNDWKTRYDAAVKAQADDLVALEDYRVGMAAQMGAYSALGNGLSAWIKHVEDPAAQVTDTEAYGVLSQAQSDRQAIHDAMNALTVPDSVRVAHDRLVGVVDDAIAAVQAAAAGTSDTATCVTDCLYVDTPAWKGLPAAWDRVTNAYQAAYDSWQAAVRAARADIAKRTLPTQPQV